MGATDNASATVRSGFVASTNPAKCTARVRIPDLDDLISYDLQVLQRKTLKDKDYWIPDLEEEVVCLFLGNGLECGFVTGALYNGEDKPPVNSRDKRHVAFEDGTWVEYDRATHRFRMHVEGALDMLSAGDINIKSDGVVWINGRQVRLNDPGAPENAALRVDFAPEGSDG